MSALINMIKLLVKHIELTDEMNFIIYMKLISKLHRIYLFIGFTKPFRLCLTAKTILFHHSLSSPKSSSISSSSSLTLQDDSIFFAVLPLVSSPSPRIKGNCQYSFQRASIDLTYTACKFYTCP